MLTRFWEDANRDDEAFGNLILDRESILERVDEYSLYCFYLGLAYNKENFKPMIKHAKYRSPIRPDDTDPSFGIFESTKSRETQYLWKDQALGLTGNIFALVKMMFGYSTDDEARRRIIKDLKLADVEISEGNKIVLAEPPEVVPIDIKISSRPFTAGELKYWAKYNISEALLKRYNVTALKYFWINSIPIVGREFSFAYRIRDKYKIYQPFGKRAYKFRNTYDETCIEGLDQLEFNQDLLIITKATKDVMFLRSLGYEAIAPRSENTPIEAKYIQRIYNVYLSHGHKVQMVTLFDNDDKNREDFYDMPHLRIPLESATKDPTDYCAMYGPVKAAQLIEELLKPYRGK